MPETDAVIVLPPLGPLDRILSRAARALEGKHPWGYVETAILSRGAWMSERLVLLPPGTSAAERRALTFHGCWPVLGACAALMLMIVTGAVLPPAVAFTAAFALYGVTLWLSSRATRPLRRAALRLTVLTVAVGGRAASYGNVASMTAARATLAGLDERARSGALSAAEYDLEWASVFWALDRRRDCLEAELSNAVAGSAALHPPT